MKNWKVSNQESSKVERRVKTKEKIQSPHENSSFGKQQTIDKQEQLKCHPAMRKAFVTTIAYATGSQLDGQLHQNANAFLQKIRCRRKRDTGREYIYGKSNQIKWMINPERQCRRKSSRKKHASRGGTSKSHSIFDCTDHANECRNCEFEKKLRTPNNPLGADRKLSNWTDK